MPPALSAEAVQASPTLPPPLLVAFSPVGTAGGVWSLDALVCAVASLLSCEELPAASRATMENTKSVFGVRFLTVAVNVVPLTCIISWPCLNTAYWVTPTLSVDLFQASVTVLSVTETTWLFVGDVGGVLSAAGCTAANAAGPAVAVSSATAPAAISDHRYLRCTGFLQLSRGGAPAGPGCPGRPRRGGGRVARPPGVRGVSPVPDAPPRAAPPVCSA